LRDAGRSARLTTADLPRRGSSAGPGADDDDGDRAGVADAAGNAMVLRYDLSLEDVGWRIDGALRLEGIDLPRPPVI